VFHDLILLNIGTPYLEENICVCICELIIEDGFQVPSEQPWFFNCFSYKEILIKKSKLLLSVKESLLSIGLWSSG
jgi:hypothetical protein